MMKYIKKPFLLFIILAGFLLSSCEKFLDRDDYRKVVVLYLAANNNLSGYAQDNIDALKQGYLPGEDDKDIMLVYKHLSGSAPELVRLFKDATGKVVEDVVSAYPDQNSATTDVMRGVLNKIKTIFPAREYGLILWSHATGWLPQGYYSSTKGLGVYMEDPYAHIVKSFAEDRGTEMEITELREAIPYSLSFILFDCCFMGGIETVYELKDKADYIIGSPTEVLATSFPYDKIMKPLFESDSDLEEVCQIFYDEYAAPAGTTPTVYNSATVALYDTDHLDKLAGVCKTIFQNRRDAISKVDRYSVQPYYRFGKDYFFDLRHFISKVATVQELAQFDEALADVVIAKWTTPEFLDIPILNYSGISTYIPMATPGELETFYRGFKWNTDTKLLD